MERSLPDEKQDREGVGTNPCAVLSVGLLYGFTPLRSKNQLERQNRSRNGCSVNRATGSCLWKCLAPRYARQCACALQWVMWPLILFGLFHVVIFVILLAVPR